MQGTARSEIQEHTFWHAIPTKKPPENRRPERYTFSDGRISATACSPACAVHSHPRTPYAGRTRLQLLPSRYRSRRARRVMESETLSIHCRTVSRSSCTRPQWPAADPVLRPVRPGQTDSQRRTFPLFACGAAPPAQTVLFLLPVHRPNSQSAAICLLSPDTPPAASASRLAAVTVTRFRALRPLREYKQ